MNILFIVPYPRNAAPSQRFRFEQYFHILEEAGHRFDVSPFLDETAWKILYKPGRWMYKTMAIIRGITRRCIDMFRLHKYDLVFVHREAMPFGPPVFEWLITKVWRKKTVYDFDDAIWIPNASESNSKLTMLLKRFANVESMCKWATKISAGNTYLMEYASRFNKRVYYNPTTIDTGLHHNTTSAHTEGPFVFGWTGSHSTIQYLDSIVPVLKELELTEDFEFHVICDVAPKFKLNFLRYIPWNKETEIQDLLKFNAGLMPLPDDVWAKGKCGFKALQYMALGIPALVSGVGVNAEIVDHEVNGCVCNSREEWLHYMKKLLHDADFHLKLATQCRRKIIEHYSVQSNKANFLQIVEDK